MTVDSALLIALRRDRAIVIAALVVLTAIAWSYVIWLAVQMGLSGAGSMANMSAMDMSHMDMSQMSPTGVMAPDLLPWTPRHFLLMTVMWGVMMVGMMTPSIAPMVLIYVQVARRSAILGRPFAPAGWFTSGYLLAWSLFSVLAALSQWGLESLALMTPMMISASRRLGGTLLIVAGAYQWMPIKAACLRQCRAPLSFVQSHGGFQSRPWGSLRLGLLHGAYCIGCCWALMLLLFVGGVMNLLWIAALMIYVLLEKLIPGGRAFSRFAGLLAASVGLWFVVT